MVNQKKRKLKATSQQKPKHFKSDSSNPLFNFGSSQTTFESLIQPVSYQQFLETNWEKEPLIISRNEKLSADKLSGLTSIFSVNFFEKVLECVRQEFNKDLHVCRFDGEKTVNVTEKGTLSVQKLKKLLADKCTLQIHQPQKYSDLLWHVLEKFEVLFGCLVGSNVYITPPGSQGLAPHYDDVEVFILQLEGEKHWKLYKPQVELSRDYVANLKLEDLGDPTHDFTLKPGDFLYFPRGTIHQASANEGSSCSTHITISTYQHNSYGDYLRNTVFSSIEELFKTSVNFRKGLPIGSLLNPWLEGAGVAGNKSVAAAHLTKMMEELSGSIQKMPLPETMLLDFWASRLPPFGVDVESLKNAQPDSSMPVLESRVQLQHKDHVCFFKREISEAMDDSDEEEDEEESSAKQEVTSDTLYFCSSLMNSRTEHMVLSTADEGREIVEPSVRLRFPLSFESALKKMLIEDTIDVKDLPLEDAEKLFLLNSLWSCHLLRVCED